MQRPPRPRSERLINWPLIARAYLFLGPLEAIAAMAAFFFVLLTGEWHYGQALSISESLYREATTACLSAIIVMQVVNVFLCRSAVNSVFSRPFFDNPIILWGVLAELALILAIDYTALGNLLFGTAPIGFEVWLFAVPFATAMLALEELRKWFVRQSALARPPKKITQLQRQNSITARRAK